MRYILEYTFNPDSARRMKYCLCDLVITKSMKFENAWNLISAFNMEKIGWNSNESK